MSLDACCTCATPLRDIPPTYDEKTENTARYERRLDCCNRAICAKCIADNPRFANYCPYCQISSGPSPLPQRLRDPPVYSPPSNPALLQDSASVLFENNPPAYAAVITPDINHAGGNSEEKSKAQDVLHFVNPEKDTITSLSLKYGVPAESLRKINKLYTDHLLVARQTVLIPGEYYKAGVSLSPQPIEGEEEAIRKNKIRKWMVTCKVAEYDIALLYLEQANYDLSQAIDTYREDELWEKSHPIEAVRRGKQRNNKVPLCGGKLFAPHS